MRLNRKPSASQAWALSNDKEQNTGLYRPGLP